MTAQKLLESLKEARSWMNNYVKPFGELDEKYGIMVFKARKGNYSIMKRIVNDYVRSLKKTDKNVVVLEEKDENLIKTWVVGNPSSIQKQTEDGF